MNFVTRLCATCGTVELLCSERMPQYAQGRRSEAMSCPVCPCPTCAAARIQPYPPMQPPFPVLPAAPHSMRCPVCGFIGPYQHFCTGAGSPHPVSYGGTI
jgi:hypothetical protein